MIILLEIIYYNVKPSPLKSLAKKDPPSQGVNEKGKKGGVGSATPSLILNRFSCRQEKNDKKVNLYPKKSFYPKDLSCQNVAIWFFIIRIEIHIFHFYKNFWKDFPPNFIFI